ncbi:50S ribosomal protein L17 [Melioribacter sp. OK-6-Me]|uniref:50S ribosomal protein L17 n=1 Tax=unclassified Melioribacter TaxID=2627329 RepID=UPI003ED941C2
MRHRVKGRKLKRTSEHRLATLRNLATSLLKHKKIKTTLAKAKELRTFVEPIITKAKVDTVANRRYVAADIKDKEVVKELFTSIVNKIGDRPGGYTRIIKLGQRKGDGAELAYIELVDFSDIVKEKASKKKTESKTKVEEKKAEEVKTDEEVKKAEPQSEVSQEPKAEAGEETSSEEKKEEN